MHKNFIGEGKLFILRYLLFKSLLKKIWNCPNSLIYYTTDVKWILKNKLSIFLIAVLKCIFWGSSFKVHPWEQLWSAFFEGAIILDGFLIHGYWLVWLLVYTFFIKIFTTNKNVYEFDMHKYKSRIIVNWLQSG